MGTYYRVFRALVKATVRHEKQRLREYKALAKQLEIANAAEAVKQYEAYIETIKSIHKNSDEPINWHAQLTEKPPIAPIKKTSHEQEVRNKIHSLQNKLENFKPNFFVKLLGSEATVKKNIEIEIDKLGVALEKAIQKDETVYLQNLEFYNNELLKYNENRDLVNGVLKGNREACRIVYEDVNPFEDLQDFFHSITVDFNVQTPTINAVIQSSEVIPNFIFTQRENGKLSKKNIPITKFNELYQDFVCGCALRIARDFFACLPLGYVLINIKSQQLDLSTGTTETKYILSVL